MGLPSLHTLPTGLFEQDMSKQGALTHLGFQCPTIIEGVVESQSEDQPVLASAHILAKARPTQSSWL